MLNLLPVFDRFGGISTRGGRLPFWVCPSSKLPFVPVHPRKNTNYKLQILHSETYSTKTRSYHIYIQQFGLANGNRDFGPELINQLNTMVMFHVSASMP
jgi:hypothetical protein